MASANAHAPGQGFCDTVRVTVKKVSPVDRTFFVKRVLWDCWRFQAADIFCLQSFPSGGYFDVTFRSMKQCEHLLKAFKENGDESPLSSLSAATLFVLSAQRSQVVAIHLYKPHIPAAEGLIFLGSLGILLRGGNFTISDVREVVGRHLLVVDVMYRNTPLRLINVYVLVVKSKRLTVLQHRPLLLATSRPVILAGDFNCIIDAVGGNGGADSKLDAMSRFLMETIKVAKLHDVFSTPADGAHHRYTWSWPDGSIRSRIDFLFVSCTFSVRCTDIKLVFFFDCCLLLANCHLQANQRASKGMWKPNVKFSTPESIEELKRDYTDCMTQSPQTVNSKVLRSAVEQRDLEVQVHSSLKASSQVDRVDKEAFSMLAFIVQGIEYRSWSVMLQLYKSLVITNRVRSALGLMIHPDQTSAVPGRKIVESLKLLRDTIAYVQDSGLDACLISLDQEKFKLASGAKIYRSKDEAMFFGNWANQSFSVFPVRTDYLKVLGIWSFRKWLAHSVVETLREKDRVDPVTWFSEQTVKNHLAECLITRTFEQTPRRCLAGGEPGTACEIIHVCLVSVPLHAALECLGAGVGVVG
eukprot:g40518.t1